MTFNELQEWILFATFILSLLLLHLSVEGVFK